MNKRFLTAILALATAGLLAIGCGSTAELEETEVVWAQTDDIWESEPGLGAEYLESEAPPLAHDDSKKATEKKIENNIDESESGY